MATATKRIWTYYKGSPVKIQLTEGKTVTLDAYIVTDEGYNHNIETYKLEDGEVYMHLDHDGRDCDGRMSYENTYKMDGTNDIGGGVKIAYFNVTKRGPIFD